MLKIKEYAPKQYKTSILQARAANVAVKKLKLLFKFDGVFYCIRHNVNKRIRLNFYKDDE